MDPRSRRRSVDAYCANWESGLSPTRRWAVVSSPAQSAPLRSFPTATTAGPTHGSLTRTSSTTSDAQTNCGTSVLTWAPLRLKSHWLGCWRKVLTSCRFRERNASRALRKTSVPIPLSWPPINWPGSTNSPHPLEGTTPKRKWHGSTVKAGGYGFGGRPEEIGDRGQWLSGVTCHAAACRCGRRCASHVAPHQFHQRDRRSRCRALLWGCV